MDTLSHTAARSSVQLPVRDAGQLVPVVAVTTTADVGDTATSALMGFMGRRIPPLYPEISEEKIREICAKIKPGDVILTADLAYPGWARMEYWTVRSNHTHAAFVGNDGNVYEAVGRGVLKGKLEDFFEGRIKVAVARIGLDEGAVARATEYCQSQVGKPYDDGFVTGDDATFYCSELVAKAVEHGDPSLHVPHRSVFGKDAIGPDAFLEMPSVARVHDDGSHYWKNKLVYWPLGASAVAGGVAGAVISGIPGAVVGGFAGFLAGVMVGNAIQTGRPLPSTQQALERKKNRPPTTPGPATPPSPPAPPAASPVAAPGAAV